MTKRPPRDEVSGKLVLLVMLAVVLTLSLGVMGVAYVTRRPPAPVFAPDGATTAPR